jgi:collagenase-like PrtC family protease
MRIVVGLPGSATPEIVERFVDAGADEFFVGYVPPAWWSRWGIEASPNRRFRAHSQFLDADTLAPVVAAARARGCPVMLTLNEHALVDQVADGLDALVDEAVQAGVTGVILATLELGPRLAARHPGLQLIASGEVPVYNRAAVRQAASFGFGRVIFARETSLDDMALLVAGRPAGLTFEAFLLGEWCVYNGALCLTSHGYGSRHDFCASHTRRAVLDVGSRTAGLDRAARDGGGGCTPDDPARAYRAACALCSLGRLRELGVDCVKLPGRSTNALGGVRLVRELLASPDLSPQAIRAHPAVAALCDPATCRSSLGVRRP